MANLKVTGVVKKSWVMTDDCGNLKMQYVTEDSPTSDSRAFVVANKLEVIAKAREIAAATLSVVYVYELVAAVQGVSTAEDLKVE
jgi:hypothetical protein